MANIAKRAATGAFVAHDHEGGRSFAKALTDVGARGFLADRDQVVFAQDVFDLMKARIGRGRYDTDPVGFFQNLASVFHLDGYARDFGQRLLLGQWVVIDAGLAGRQDAVV